MWSGKNIFRASPASSSLDLVLRLFRVIADVLQFMFLYFSSFYRRSAC